MFIEFTLALVGLVILTFAADHLVIGSSRLATRLRISPVVVGVVVIGLGTSAPEFLVSGVAAARGDTGIAVGNIIGSNVLNLTLILGVAALIGTIRVTTTIVSREVPLAAGAVAVFGLLAWWALNPATAAILAALLVGALYLLVRWARVGRNKELAVEVTELTQQQSEPAAGARRAWVETLRAAFGLAGVLVGAQLLVANASTIAETFGVPQIVIGFTLVALGTSLPELVTTIAAQRRGESELVVGNLFGSNLFNSLAGGAIIGFTAEMGRPARASLIIVAVMTFTTVIAWALLRRGLRLTRAEGVVLLTMYAITVPILLST